MVICVTNRKLCTDDFLLILERACDRSNMVILREKDLTQKEYCNLAEKVSKLCYERKVLFCINSFIEVAKKVPCDALQLAYPSFYNFVQNNSFFCSTGVSIHSVHEAVEAQRLGASFLIAGHIFETSSKLGLPPRGLNFLREVVSAVKIPVYAIGGIQFSHAESLLKTGAKGFCMMSQMMQNKE